MLRYWVGSWAAICCASCLFTVKCPNDNYLPKNISSADTYIFAYISFIHYQAILFFTLFNLFVLLFSFLPSFVVCLWNLFIRLKSNFRIPLPMQVSTFLIDSSRFQYPERAIVYLAICYLIVGCAYVAGLGAGDSAACREAFPPPIRLGKLSMYSTITMVRIYILSLCLRYQCNFQTVLLIFKYTGSSPIYAMHNSFHGIILLFDGCICVVDVLSLSLVPSSWNEMGSWSNWEQITYFSFIRVGHSGSTNH